MNGWHYTEKKRKKLLKGRKEIQGDKLWFIPFENGKKKQICCLCKQVSAYWLTWLCYSTSDHSFNLFPK